MHVRPADGGRIFSFKSWEVGSASKSGPKDWEMKPRMSSQILRLVAFLIKKKITDCVAIQRMLTMGA